MHADIKMNRTQDERTRWDITANTVWDNTNLTITIFQHVE